MTLHKNLIKKWINTSKGWGIFVKEPIKKGEVVMIDSGRVLTAQEYFSLSPEQQNLTYQIDFDKVIVPNDFNHISDEWFVNHSCTPNTILSQGTWIASKDLNEGEELTHDYALVWTNDLEPFEINPCLCGSKNCRGKMTGDDWKISELQEKYKNQFMPYVMEKIEKAHRP
jgi:SET domain-containing protein